MCLEVTFLIESLTTAFKGTHIVFDSIVLLDMNTEALYSTVGFIATLDGALVRFDILMCLHVVFKMAFRHEVLLASFHWTFKWSTVLYK